MLNRLKPRVHPWRKDSGDFSSEMEYTEHTQTQIAPKFWQEFLVMKNKNDSLKILHAIAIAKGI